jgi:lysozyme family protein
MLQILAVCESSIKREVWVQKVFDNCLAFVLEQEGGYSNDSADPGGETNWGISKRAHPTVDIKNLSRNGAGRIYEVEYWQPSHCDDMPAPIALCVFDMAVNMGISRSAKILQEALGVPDDGIIGPQTLFESSGADVTVTVRKIHDLREAFYRGRMGFDRFGKGWLARNDACRDLALSWMGEPA